MDILNDILSALSIGLDGLYPNIPVFAEQVPAKLPRRCFLIGYVGEVAMTRELGGRHCISGKLDITYLPPQKEDETELRREMNSVFARIALGLTDIQYRDLRLQLRGHVRQDAGDVLHDICKFKTFLLQADTIPAIGNISIGKEELK